MNTQPDINNLIRQTRQYEFADGLRDLQNAVVFVSLGITSWLVLDLVYLPYIANLMKIFGRSAAWLSLLLVFTPSILGIGMLGIMGYVRRRWLWRKSGMVKPRPQMAMAPRWVVVLATMTYILIIVIVFVTQRANTPLILQLLIVAAGWSTGINLIGLGISIGLPRYTWLGLLGGLLSTSLLFVNLTFGQTALAFGLAWGMMFAVIGTVLLVRFLYQVGGEQ